MIILTQNKIINEFVHDVRPSFFETEHFNTIKENFFYPVDEKKLKMKPLSKKNQDEIVEMVEIQLLILLQIYSYFKKFCKNLSLRYKNLKSDFNVLTLKLK